jgi:hypothetical protein
MKRARRGVMTAHRDGARAAHAFELVRRLACAVEVELIEKRTRVDVTEPPGAHRCRQLADRYGVGERAWQVFARAFERVHDAQVEMLDPEIGRRGGGLVPIVLRLVKHQRGSPPR